jgi:hypothetical protein
MAKIAALSLPFSSSAYPLASQTITCPQHGDANRLHAKGCSFPLPACTGQTRLALINLLCTPLHSLSNNNIGTEGAAAIGDALTHNHSLVILGWVQSLTLVCLFLCRLLLVVFVALHACIAIRALPQLARAFPFCHVSLLYLVDFTINAPVLT